MTIPVEFAEANRVHAALVRRMAGGDAEAARAFYDLFVDRVYGIVTRILFDPQDAKEVVQDTFVKAWRQAGSYAEERGEVFPWLVLIARNTAIDRLRARKRRHEILTQFAEETGSESAAADRSTDTREFVARTLARLEPPQRRALELAFFGGCSQAEVAQHMELPVTTVKNLLHRGMLRLREVARRHE